MLIAIPPSCVAAWTRTSHLQLCKCDCKGLRRTCIINARLYDMQGVKIIQGNYSNSQEIILILRSVHCSACSDCRFSCHMFNTLWAQLLSHVHLISHTGSNAGKLCECPVNLACRVKTSIRIRSELRSVLFGNGGVDEMPNLHVSTNTTVITIVKRSMLQTVDKVNGITN